MCEAHTLGLVTPLEGELLSEDMVNDCLLMLASMPGIYAALPGFIGPTSFINSMTFRVVSHKLTSVEGAVSVAFIGVPLIVEISEPQVVPCDNPQE